MNFLSVLLDLILPGHLSGWINSNHKDKILTMHVYEAPIYKVVKLKKSIYINANWNKSEWRKIKPIDIKHYMGKVSAIRMFLILQKELLGKQIFTKQAAKLLIPII